MMMLSLHKSLQKRWTVEIFYPVNRRPLLLVKDTGRHTTETLCGSVLGILGKVVAVSFPSPDGIVFTGNL